MRGYASGLQISSKRSNFESNFIGKHVMASAFPVLISGARAPVALHLARLFSQAGHQVILVDHLKHPLAAASRLDVEYQLIPAFATEPDAAFASLSEIITRNGIKLVIPTCEEALHLGAIWAQNDMSVELFAPDFALLNRVHNKFRFIELCAEIGLDVPKTHLINNESERERHEAFSSKLVFKPVWSRFGSNVLIRPDAARLRQIKPSAEMPWIAQEYHSGTELCVYAVARRGRIVALSVYRGLVHAGLGAAVCFEPVDADVARPFVERFVQTTDWTGQISFDLILTEDERVIPLECNPRATSGLHFFTKASTFTQALLSGNAIVEPDINYPMSMRLALWAYGLPMMLNRRKRSVFLNALRLSGDVMDWPDDRVRIGAQLRSMAEFFGIALRNRISLERASTCGIEWNGEN